jgi:hypothetical protein
MPSGKKPRRNGGSRSISGSLASKREVVRVNPKLRLLLERIFDNCREGLRADLSPEEYQRQRHDFAFHMTDWLTDLKELNELYAHPEKADLEQATISIIGTLYHVIPHLNAAGRLLLDTIPDAFAPPQAKPKAKRERKPKTRAG